MLALAAQIAAFTGQPVTLDARLRPPPCRAAVEIFWTSPARDGVGVTCTAPGWQLFVPVTRVNVAAPRTAPIPAVRKGDRVAVAATGTGFRVTVDAVVEADAPAGGRVRLRNRASGEVVQGIVGEDGDVRAAGFKSGGGSR